jgi:hypothetical protein
MVEHPDWPRCRGWIEAAAGFSPLADSLEQIEEKLGDGRLQFWPGARSAAVTEIAAFGGRRAMIVRYGGGELDELLQTIEPALCAVARAMGCTLILSEGRMGWKKAAQARGYQFAWLTMLKEI